MVIEVRIVCVNDLDLDDEKLRIIKSSLETLGFKQNEISMQKQCSESFELVFLDQFAIKSKQEENTGCICKEGDGMWIDCECWECERKLSQKDMDSLIEDIKLEELMRKRNILNRKISTLKKVALAK